MATPPPASLHALAAYLRTRRLARMLRTRADVERRRERRLRAFLSHVVPAVPFYAGRPVRTLADLPVMDKAVLLANFAALNRRGVTLAQAVEALEAGRSTVAGLTVGRSTGTSGNRGVYVISEAERFAWLGVLVAKALPDALRVRHRVAVALPRVGRLYASANASGRLVLRGFDPAEGIGRWRDDLARFAPDVLVAAPRTLRLLADAPGFAPRHVFSGAEVLDPLDRAAIEAGFGVRVREIYMATEGLFGVACPLGTLHLAEDAVAFEWEPVADGSGLLSPLVTDFTRRTQVMARYRMNDLVRLATSPCPCGSPLQAVDRIEGRRDDVFLLADGEGGLAPATPDVVRDVVVAADARIADFRVVQLASDRVELRLAPDLPGEAAQAAQAALSRAFARLGASAVTVSLGEGLGPAAGVKLRRVRREWSPA